MHAVARGRATVRQDARVSRLRSAAILTICALLVGGFAVLAVADPFHLRHARWFTATLVLVALALVTSAVAVLARRGLARMLVLTLGGAVMLGWVTLVWLTAQLTGPNREVSQVTDEGHRLVVLEGGAFSIDPVYAVVVRAGGGPFEQESVVYQGPEAVPAPAAVRFVDPDMVEVRTTEGCLFRSEVEQVTLAVDPVHRPLRPGSC